jgi:hypothetical protein
VVTLTDGTRQAEDVTAVPGTAAGGKIVERTLDLDSMRSIGSFGLSCRRA